MTSDAGSRLEDAPRRQGAKWARRRPAKSRGGAMTVKLAEDTEKRLVASIKRFFEEEMDEPVGDLKALRVLDFFVREVAPSVYNQAIADAQAYLTDSVADLSGARYEAEFDYWKKK
jgi:uncharacterized protein (DUF2164 family)